MDQDRLASHVVRWLERELRFTLCVEIKSANSLWCHTPGGPVVWVRISVTKECKTNHHIVFAESIDVFIVAYQNPGIVLGAMFD